MHRYCIFLLADGELPDVVGGPAERLKKGNMQETKMSGRIRRGIHGRVATTPVLNELLATPGT
jgi:hypothetical protein